MYDKLIEILNSESENDVSLGVDLAKEYLNNEEIIKLRKVIVNNGHWFESIMVPGKLFHRYFYTDYL